MFCVNYDQITFIDVYAFVMTIIALMGFISAIIYSTKASIVESNLRIDNDYYENYINMLEKDLDEAEARAEIYDTKDL